LPVHGLGGIVSEEAAGPGYGAARCHPASTNFQGSRDKTMLSSTLPEAIQPAASAVQRAHAGRGTVATLEGPSDGPGHLPSNQLLSAVSHQSSAGYSYNVHSIMDPFRPHTHLRTFLAPPALPNRAAFESGSSGMPPVVQPLYNPLLVTQTPFIMGLQSSSLSIPPPSLSENHLVGHGHQMTQQHQPLTVGTAAAGNRFATSSLSTALPAPHQQLDTASGPDPSSTLSHMLTESPLQQSVLQGRAVSAEKEVVTLRFQVGNRCVSRSR
jgi:hypothetical protein